VIATWRKCIDCAGHFGLTLRQDHEAVFAPMLRCPPCRTIHERSQGRLRTQKWRQRQRDAQSAPIHATDPSVAVNGAQSYA
jgi:hypothetical protein